MAASKPCAVDIPQHLSNTADGTYLSSNVCWGMFATIGLLACWAVGAYYGSV